jgi:hypothetical protein
MNTEEAPGLRGRPYTDSGLAVFAGAPERRCGPDWITGSKAGVAHPIGVVRRVLGFTKVRYRGLKENALRLMVTRALANLFMARRQLLRWQQAWCARTRQIHRVSGEAPPKAELPSQLRLIPEIAMHASSLAAPYSDFH